MKICFTGHRQIEESKSDALKSRLYLLICDLCSKGANEFYCGGALGFDTICAQTVLDAKERFKDIKLILVLPCRNEEQTRRWGYKSKHEFYSLMMFADEVEYTGSEYTAECMKKRNARLVEAADICVAYFDNENYRSGTAQTIRMANKKGIEVINLYK